MTTLNDLNGDLDDEAYTVRVGELRALLSASIADTAPKVEMTIDEASAVEFYAHTPDVALQDFKARSKKLRDSILGTPVESIADTAGAKPVAIDEIVRSIYGTCATPQEYRLARAVLAASCADSSASALKVSGDAYMNDDGSITFAAPPAPSVADAAGASDQFTEYRRGAMEAFNRANMINLNRQGRTAEETCAYLVRSLAELADGGAKESGND